MSYLARKLPRYAAIVFIISTINFFIPRLMPGDPVLYLLGEHGAATTETVETLREELGLNRPLFDQYLSYWKHLVQLDLGYSYHSGQDVWSLIRSRLGWTLILLLPALVLGTLAGGILGALSGWRRKSRGAKLCTMSMLAIHATPPYFLSMIALYFLSVQWDFFPLKGFYETGTLLDILHHNLIPTLIIFLFTMARNHLIVRGSVLEEMDKPYVTYARAKGLGGRKILFGHIFRNASLPLVTMAALDFGFLLSGALFVEIVFSLNGLGSLLFDATLSRDYPVLQGMMFVITIMVIGANMTADLLYRFLDPRVRSHA